MVVKMTKLLLLDCDGTIRVPASGKQFIQHPQDQKIIEGAAKAITHYYQEGWEIYGISNQGGVEAGHKSINDAITEQAYTLSLIPEIKGIYFCPDFNGEKIVQVFRHTYNNYERSEFLLFDSPEHLLYNSFRKPSNGMVMFAIDQLEFSPDYVVMVGDREEDQLSVATDNIKFLWAKAWWH